MKRFPICHLFPLILALAVPSFAGAAGGAIHGSVHTTEGKTLTGELRWDRNENFWGDRLDGSKEEVIVLADEQESTFTFLGLRLPRWGSSETRIRPQFSIPFGHVSTIEIEGDDWARVQLKSGTSFRVRASSTDLGPGLRGLMVIPATGEATELKWADLRSIEFSPTISDATDSQRLYGTVASRRQSFTGFVVWDKDESMLNDILDGEDRDAKHEIPFATIKTITRDGYDASRVTLDNGKELRLEGTNDVDEDNRGIVVTIPEQGTVEIPWDEFVSFKRQTAPPSPTYDSFDGGYRLAGVLTSADGGKHRGAITWDLDEAYSWETLEGTSGDLEYSVHLAHISSIEHSTRQGVILHLRNGSMLELRGSNDVDESNKGILVTLEDGSTRQFSWDEFQNLSLEEPSRE